MTPATKEQWLPSTWPVSLRWRLLAAVLVCGLTAILIFALSRDRETHTEMFAVAAAQRWTQDHPVGEYAVVSVTTDLAPLLVVPSDLDGKMAAVDVPEGALVSPEMLRPQVIADETRTTTLMRFTVSAEMWPQPGPASGDLAIFSPSPGGCAAAEEVLVAVDGSDGSATVTVEASPELATSLSDAEWWIWESPPAGWPACSASEFESPFTAAEDQLSKN